MAPAEATLGSRPTKNHCSLMLCVLYGFWRALVWQMGPVDCSHTPLHGFVCLNVCVCVCFFVIVIVVVAH